MCEAFARAGDRGDVGKLKQVCWIRLLHAGAFVRSDANGACPRFWKVSKGSADVLGARWSLREAVLLAAADLQWVSKGSAGVLAARWSYYAKQFCLRLQICSG
jgi:hypothetical protein